MIPLSRPLLGDEENVALAEVLASGRLVQGERVSKFQALVAGYTGRKHALAVSSGTAALRVALEALGVGRGDAVLVPDLTWPSPAHVVVELGALPVLVDVDRDSWNATAASMAEARASHPNVRAAIAIDQFGNPCPAREIAAALPGIPLVVDAACALGSRARDFTCGALGVIACLSFHPRKVLTTGEGGMCLTDDDTLAARLSELRNHGQVTPGVFARASGNHRMSELAAAVGVVQMSRLDAMVAERQRLAARYANALTQLSPQRAPEGARLNHQTFGVVLPEGTTHVERDRVVETLRARGVETARLSYALHTLPQLRESAEQAARAGRSFAVSSALADRGLALPLWPGLSDAMQDEVITTLLDVLK